MKNDLWRCANRSGTTKMGSCFFPLAGAIKRQAPYFPEHCHLAKIPIPRYEAARRVELVQCEPALVEIRAVVNAVQ